MGVCEIATFFVSIIFFGHTVFATFSHNDCDKDTIKKNYVRVRSAYPSIPSQKRSVGQFHDNRFPLKDFETLDTVLYNFPQSMPYNFEMQSYKLPILSGNNQQSISSYPLQPQALGLPYRNPPIYYSGFSASNQLQSNNLNSFGFPQNGRVQLLLPAEKAEQPSNRQYDLQNILSMLANTDAFPMEPLKRLRRDCIESELINFVQECCSETGCPFPTAYINLGNRIQHCKRALADNGSTT